MAASPELLVDLAEVSFAYPADAHTRSLFWRRNKAPARPEGGAALRGVSLRVHAGDRVLVLGPNGSGKSTLLAILAGRRRAGCGAVRVLGGHDPFEDAAAAGAIAHVAAAWPAEATFGCTIGGLAGAGARVAALAAALRLRAAGPVDGLGAGGRRRAQLLAGLARPARLILLDESGADLDAGARGALLGLVRDECRAHAGCCLYATHIPDGLAGWPTHVLRLRAGRVEDFHAVSALPPAPPFSPPSPDAGAALSDARRYAAGGDDVVSCRELSFREVFTCVGFTIGCGARVLLCGANDSGKSTLLRLLGGRQYFDNRAGALRVLGKPCYDDMTFLATVAYGGEWWARAPDGEVYVRELLRLDTRRAQWLCELLAVNLDWEVGAISSGELRRVQILLSLIEDKPLVLLDEATSDLDVDHRYALLKFLYLESVCRGVTVIYATHIFCGLQGWANMSILLDRTNRGVHAIQYASDGAEIDTEALTEEIIKLQAEEDI